MTTTAFLGRPCLITGASSGIGAALARAFAAAGAPVVLTARRLDRLEGLAASIEEEHGVRALALAADVTRDGDVAAAVARTVDELGSLGVVVANAGFGVAGELRELSLDDYRRQMETNLFGVIRTIQESLPALEESRGQVAIMGSVKGHVSLPGTSPYSMSKHAMKSLAESLRVELAPRGVRVTLISPGFVASEIRQVDNQGQLREEQRDPVPDWLVMDSDVAARKMLRAIASAKAEEVVTLHGKLVVFLVRHFPWLTRLVIDRFGIRGGKHEDDVPGEGETS